MSTGRNYQAEKVGVFSPKRVERDALRAGDVGFVIAGVKEIDGAPVGDTVTLHIDARRVLLSVVLPVVRSVTAGVPRRQVLSVPWRVGSPVVLPKRR